MRMQSIAQASGSTSYAFQVPGFQWPLVHERTVSGATTDQFGFGGLRCILLVSRRKCSVEVPRMLGVEWTVQLDIQLSSSARRHRRLFPQGEEVARPSAIW